MNESGRQAPAQELVFVKLGGSVITDKLEPETARSGTISRLAAEVSSALEMRSDMQIVLGHGSGSFGHMAARKYGTREGVRGRTAWQGFAEVADVAARLNRIVTGVFLASGVPVWSLPPSASARCRGGNLTSLETAPLKTALDQGLVPLIYGDVALDDQLGGTIISTEQIFAYLARRLRPARMILVGVVDGVFEGDPLQNSSSKRVPEISPSNWAKVQAMLGASFAPDVTGGMATKVEEMVLLAQELTGLAVHLLSGERAGALEAALLDRASDASGTVIRWQK